jgi:hypothetical protein
LKHKHLVQTSIFRTLATLHNDHTQTAISLDLLLLLLLLLLHLRNSSAAHKATLTASYVADTTPKGVKSVAVYYYHCYCPTTTAAAAATITVVAAAAAAAAAAEKHCIISMKDQQATAFSSTELFYHTGSFLRVDHMCHM